MEDEEHRPGLTFDPLTVSCPYCGALPGKECKRVKGHDFPLETPRHHHRFEKARKDAAQRRQTKENE